MRTSPELPTDLAGVLRMQRESERGRAEARERADRLFGLQDALVEIASARSTPRVAELVLLAARRHLAYERAIWFAVEAGDIAVERFRLDGSDHVAEVEEVAHFDARLLGELLRRSMSQPRLGDETELCAPLVDVRRWYVAAPVVPGRAATALLYVDDHPNDLARADADLVASLVRVAAVALQTTALVSELDVLAHRDPLTGLFNRRAFAEHLDRSLSRAEPFVLLMIDVDDFKQINDRRGHAGGDAHLLRLSRALTGSSRLGDVVGRFAGDEFVVILSDVAPGDALTMTTRLCGEIQRAGISCSVGAACYPTAATDRERLFARADAALYRSKTSGKNRFTIWADG